MKPRMARHSRLRAIRQGSLVAIILIVVAQGQQRRPPEPGPIKPFKLPSVKRAELANGLALALVEDRRAPLVTIHIGLRVGWIDDPPGRAGLAEATSHLITQRAELARRIETLGGRIASHSNPDYTELVATIISENAAQMLDIVAEMVLRPTFSEAEIKLYKKNRLQELIVQRQDPAFLASEHFNRIVYGRHPYSTLAPSARTITTLSRAGVEAFYRSHYSPTGSIITVVGDFDFAAIESKLRDLFGNWRPIGRARRHIPDPPAPCRGIYLIDRPGSEQADIRIGNLAVARRHEDYFPLLLANAILGGGASSRLFLSLREQKGFAYDVSSAVSSLRLAGTFFASTQTRTEAALPAIMAMIGEFERLRDQKVSAEELRGAKNLLGGAFWLLLSTQGGIADQIVSAHMVGLGPDHIESYRYKVESVSAEQLQRAARKYILTDRFTLIVVGDAAKLKSGLSRLGRVRLLSAPPPH
jgi:zinc protease